jgi:hypothetical protein
VNITRTIGRIAAVLVTVAALTALAGVAQAQSSMPPGMSQAEYQALMLRSEALNQEYGLGAQTPAAAPSQSTDQAEGFAWGAFGIGVAVMFGLALVAGGVVARHRLVTTRGPAPYRTT